MRIFFFQHILDRAHWHNFRPMSEQQFKQLTELKDSTYFPLHFTIDHIDALVMDGLMKADAYTKPPGNYRYYFTTGNISGYKYRENRTSTLYTNCILYRVNRTWYGRDIVLKTIYPTTRH